MVNSVEEKGEVKAAEVAEAEAVEGDEEAEAAVP